MDPAVRFGASLLVLECFIQTIKGKIIVNIYSIDVYDINVFLAVVSNLISVVHVTLHLSLCSLLQLSLVTTQLTFKKILNKLQCERQMERECQKKGFQRSCSY